LRKNILGINCKVPTTKKKRVNYINFDNAASTPPLFSVIKETESFMQWYAGVHRGSGFKSLVASKTYDQCYQTIGRFVNVDLENNTVIMVKNTTEAINKLAYRLQLSKGDIVISSVMEHHSNDLPWRQKAKVEYIGLNQEGLLCQTELENKLRRYYPRVKLVAICGASNVTGQLNDIHQIAALAHKYGTPILVDAAQLIPHHPIDMKDDRNPMHIDFLAFSGHKIYAPFGSGCLIGPKKLFLQGDPEYAGGGMVKLVFKDKVWWADLPEREEAGSPNVAGTFALAKTLGYLEGIGMHNISAYERSLTDYTIDKLKQIPNITIYGTGPRVGVISFNLAGIPHALVGAILCYETGIGTRTGCFCAQNYVRKLLNHDENSNYISLIENRQQYKIPGMVRISFGAYNTRSEVDKIINYLYRISENKKHYLNSYYYSPADNQFFPPQHSWINKWVDKTIQNNFA
jgi:selenocysteine lyase/cysteine desulfurase